MTILVTGGSGYIGSHCVYTLLDAGYDVLVLDNLSNSALEPLARIERMSGKKITFIKGDLCSLQDLDATFRKYNIASVIHFAGLKAVKDSVTSPLEYYRNNVHGTINLLDTMARFGVYNLIFSSSATVYGQDQPLPYTEELEIGKPSSPYGATKAVVEQILLDLSVSNDKWKIVSLRYFNPIGAHCSGEIGEDPFGVPNNLLPYIAQVAIGRLTELSIYGDDYDTDDGTCERDYLHVMDLAAGHLAALAFLLHSKSFHGLEVFNLGSGKPISVLQMLKVFVKFTGVDIPYKIAPRREGDLPKFWADPSKAKSILGWQCKHDLQVMIEDTWRWQSKYPKGYAI